MSINIKGITSSLGYQQITSMGSAGGLTLPTTDKNGLKQKPTVAWIVAESQDVRWRDDGTDPSATVGMLLPKNTLLVYDGDLSKIKFIETTASAKLNVSYYA